jgi:hypothetical protein
MMCGLFDFVGVKMYREVVTLRVIVGIRARTCNESNRNDTDGVSLGNTTHGDKSVERQKRIALDLISYSDLTYWCATASML